MKAEFIDPRDTVDGPARFVTTWEPPAALEEIATDENGLIDELVESYCTDVADRVGKMVAAVENGDLAVVKQQAHAVKGSSKQMEAHIVASLCEQVEAACREVPAGDIGGLVNELEIQVREISAAMIRYQKWANRTNTPAKAPPASGPMMGIGA